MQWSSTLTLIPYSLAFPGKSGNIRHDYKQVGEEFTIGIK